MTEKFHNRYRIASARLQNWDYGSNAAYFITICTHNRINYFASIHDAQMQLSPLGVFAHQFWMEIPVHFPFVKLDADFGWQSRYHEHIIRNDESYQRISHYITNNPSNWHKDKFYTD